LQLQNEDKEFGFRDREIHFACVVFFDDGFPEITKEQAAAIGDPAGLP
jgi:hypothetical protein